MKSNGAMKAMRIRDALARLPGLLLIALVRGYRLLLSPVLAPSCRFWPSCSEYAMEALRNHGAARGSWLSARRLCRCHPWATGGIDNVPPAGFSNNRWRAYESSRQDSSDSSVP